MSNVKFTTDPLLDNEFLLNLTKSRNKETFARITALTWEETPVEYIEGRITGGTINLDGTSIVRRTCSLSMIAQDINLNNFYWGLNSKIKIEIGLSNSINNAYPNIIWFPQGVFILTTFNTSLSVNNYSISLSAKDKMCMLNGDIGGKLNASIDFGVEEYIDLATNTITYYKIPIKDIIKNSITLTINITTLPTKIRKIGGKTTSANSHFLWKLFYNIISILSIIFINFYCFILTEI